MFSYGGFEVSETDGLQAYVGVVEVLYRRLNQQDFQFRTRIYPTRNRIEPAFLRQTCQEIVGRV